MKESIRAEGVIQPILLRPVANADYPYEVVYGNTRFDISVDLGISDIPAIIRDMTDVQARRAATIENIQRADLTPIEESYAAVTELADQNNNHEEACRTLGWSRTKLDARILLSKCCDDVAEALVQGDIKLGHAELLAPMTHDDQRLICSRIVERKMTVAATRERLIQLSGVIAHAPSIQPPAKAASTTARSSVICSAPRWVKLSARTALAGRKRLTRSLRSSSLRQRRSTESSTPT